MRDRKTPSERDVWLTELLIYEMRWEQSEEKAEMNNFQQQYALWDEFLSVWPASRLATLTLDEYSKAGSKDSFTYWIESRLDEMGSIWGGSSFKLGPVRRAGGMTGGHSVDRRTKMRVVFHCPQECQHTGRGFHAASRRFRRPCNRSWQGSRSLEQRGRLCDDAVMRRLATSGCGNRRSAIPCDP